MDTWEGHYSSVSGGYPVPGMDDCCHMTRMNGKCPIGRDCPYIEKTFETSLAPRKVPNMQVGDPHWRTVRPMTDDEMVTAMKPRDVNPTPYVPLVPTRWLWKRIAVIAAVVVALAAIVPCAVDISHAIGKIAYQHITGVSMSP